MIYLFEFKILWVQKLSNQKIVHNNYALALYKSPLRNCYFTQELYIKQSLKIANHATKFLRTFSYSVITGLRQPNCNN